MKTIRKVKSNIYLEGDFSLRDKKENWVCFIEFPTIFTAFGAAIKSGNWQSCTAINTPKYVINEYLHENRC